MNNKVIQMPTPILLIITGSLNYISEKCIGKELNIFQLLNSPSINLSSKMIQMIHSQHSELPTGLLNQTDTL